MYRFRDPYPTKHFIEKMNARAVTWAEVVEIVDAPEVVYGPDARGHRILQRGDLSVVVASDGAVLTVLLRNEDEWDDDQAKSRKEITPNLSYREQAIVSLLRAQPGLTVAEIVPLLPEIKKSQVENALYTTLQAKGLIEHDKTNRPYRWYVKD